MLRKIIEIDEDLCTGCRACVDACHEGAIALVGGKAKLVRDDYCDGLGDCLPACPTGAISFTVREAAAYDEAAVAAHQGVPSQAPASEGPGSGCPGARMRSFAPASGCPGSRARSFEPADTERHRVEDRGDGGSRESSTPSELRQWPVQIKLVPERAPYFAGADVVVAADCTAFAYGGFHADLLRGKILLIGCPKLDEGEWADKLARIVAQNDIRSLTVVRMEVPCCGGLERAVVRAAEESGRDLPVSVVTVTVQGDLSERMA